MNAFKFTSELAVIFLWHEGQSCRTRRAHLLSEGVRAFPALIRAGLIWEKAMKKWKSPRIRMISVGCEINAYACADI